MSDKKIMIVIFSSLIVTAAFQLATTPTNNVVQSHLLVQSSAYGPSIAATDVCVDCVKVDETDAIAIEECDKFILCENWIMCTDECLHAEDQQLCYENCNVMHSDDVAECSVNGESTCNACSEQCVDVCMADG